MKLNSDVKPCVQPKCGILIYINYLSQDSRERWALMYMKPFAITLIKRYIKTLFYSICHLRITALL